MTARGIETIRICGLDRPSLLELYKQHVRDFVRPAIEQFVNAARTEDARIVINAWNRLCRRVDAPGQQFRALSRDAVKTLAPRSICNEYRLTL